MMHGQIPAPTCESRCIATSRPSLGAADIDKCKTIETDEGTACVNQASNMNSASKEDLKNLLALHRSLEGFSDTCPLTDALDGDASTCANSPTVAHHAKLHSQFAH